MPIAAGTKLGRYEIRSQLGAGGMGEVYLAQDTKLNRKVALKILPADVTADRNRMGRFEQEARAASALNHPNILTIHEIGVERATHFIATEYIDGETLRAKLRFGRMKLDEALDVAQQIAFALTAAHATGIVHRDIKPENVMLRQDGIVKVLDFGLAKLAEEKRAPMSDSQVDTRALVRTDPGVVMGTVDYMSPEQARGVELDARTDVWSLGVVLFEMVTGCGPFKGETKSHVVVAILEQEVPPLTKLVPDTPPELQRIVRKALTKDRNNRYQTARDLMIDLRNLRRELDLQGEIELSTGSQANSPDRVSPSTGALKDISSPDPVPSTSAAGETTAAQSAGTHPASSAEYVVGTIKRHRLALIVTLVVFVFAVGFSIAALISYRHASTTEVAIESIAVLPFENQNHDPDSEYLSDGVTESIINSLTQLPNLKVIARSSVFRYKGKANDPFTAGKELGVRAILTGRILQRGDNLTIRTELVDVRDNKQLWGEQYTRKLSDVLAMQEEIASEISSKLRLKLSGEEQRRVTRRYTDNIEAYQLYLRGRFEANKYTPEGLKQSIDYFNQAIALDPAYALAYAGMADSYTTQSHIGLLAPKEGFAKVKSSAQKALEIDDKLAEAHRAVAAASLFYDWDWPVAERELKRAIDLEPNSANAHFAHSLYFKAMGRYHEYLTEAGHAQELDPLSPELNMEVAESYYFTRQYDQAIEHGKRSLELDPHFWLAYHIRARALEQKGMYGDAITEYKKAIDMLGNDPIINESLLASLGHVYATAGQRGEAQKILDQLLMTAKQRYVPSYIIAKVYAGLGDKDQAFAWLEKGFEERYFLMTWLKGEPQFDSLRADPRFADLLRRIGLPA